MGGRGQRIVSFADILGATLILAGAFFFLAGTVGLLRFPDVYMRLHALTKADTLGLGLVVAGLAVRAGDLLAAMKLALVWVLAALAAASIGHMVARAALREGVAPWRRR